MNLHVTLIIIRLHNTILPNLLSFLSLVTLAHLHVIVTILIRVMPVNMIVLRSFFALAVMHVFLNPTKIWMEAPTRTMRLVTQWP